MTWMDLKDILLSEVSQAQTGKCTILPIRSPQGVPSIETDSRPCQGLGEEDKEFMFSGDRVSVWKDEKAERRMVVIVVQQYGCT